MKKKRASFIEALMESQAAEASRLISRYSALDAVPPRHHTKNDISGSGKGH